MERFWNNKNSHLSMVVVKYVIASMEDSLAYSYRTKIVLSYDLEFAFLFTQLFWKFYSKSACDVHSNFIHIVPNLEAIKVHFSSKWTNKFDTSTNGILLSYYYKKEMSNQALKRCRCILEVEGLSEQIYSLTLKTIKGYWNKIYKQFE